MTNLLESLRPIIASIFAKVSIEEEFSQERQDARGQKAALRKISPGHAKRYSQMRKARHVSAWKKDQAARSKTASKLRSSKPRGVNTGTEKLRGSGVRKPPMSKQQINRAKSDPHKIASDTEKRERAADKLYKALR
jgi:hypothetical protein